MYLIKKLIKLPLRKFHKMHIFNIYCYTEEISDKYIF